MELWRIIREHYDGVASARAIAREAQPGFGVAKAGFMGHALANVSPSAFVARWKRAKGLEMGTVSKATTMFLCKTKMFLNTTKMFLHKAKMFLHKAKMFLCKANMFLHTTNMFLHKTDMFLNTTETFVHKTKTIVNTTRAVVKTPKAAALITPINMCPPAPIALKSRPALNDTHRLATATHAR